MFQDFGILIKVIIQCQVKVDCHEITMYFVILTPNKNNVINIVKI